jgi:hypothetical protein
MTSPAVRCDIQIDPGCSAAICGEIGDRLCISLKGEPKGVYALDVPLASLTSSVV